MKQIYFFFLIVGLVTPLWAANGGSGPLLRGDDLTPISLQAALKGVGAGDVVVLGEMHGTLVLAAQQVEVLKALREQGLKISVGMEFVEHPYQAQLDAWKQGKLSDDTFLKAIHWNGYPFQAYRQQMSFPVWPEEFTLALNAPRSVTGKIAKNGLESLTLEERGLLPADFTIGNDRYLERFKEQVGHVPDPTALQRYFMAQSAWDDTMAWKATDFLKVHPEQTLVIVVGEFHVRYGGGLPDRLRARGAKSVTTFSQLNLYKMTDEEQKQELQPSPRDGKRADYIWTSNFSFGGSSLRSN